MTIIKKLNKKIIAAVLSFAMVLTGVFSFGAIKKETASASMQDFVALMLAELLEEPGIGTGGRNLCMIVDNQLITGVSSGSKINTVAGDHDSFLREIATQLNISCTTTAFRNFGFYIFAQVDGTNDKYVDLIYGKLYKFSDLEQNFLTNIKSGVSSNLGFTLDDTLFCGVMQWTTNQEIISYFSNFKGQLGTQNFPVYAMYDGTSSTPMGVYGLPVRYYEDGYGALVDEVV